MILDDIVVSTKKLLAERKLTAPLSQLERRTAEQPIPQDFAAALKGAKTGLIAEVKRASPSKGWLAPNLDAPRLAKIYGKSGAAAISVLTESEYFKGSLADLESVRQAVKIPLLRKDFIVDPYQIYEARAYGADAVLLIAAILSANELKVFNSEVHSLKMKPLIEVHNRPELERVLELEPEIIGVNNRNLADFSVSLNTTVELCPMIGANTVVVSESGIHTGEDVIMLEGLGINAVLVGEELVTSPDPAARIKKLMSW